jgi:hypothetical protein
LRNGKRQIVNLCCRETSLGMPGSFSRSRRQLGHRRHNMTLQVCSLDAFVGLCYRRANSVWLLSWLGDAGCGRLRRARHRRRSPHPEGAAGAPTARNPLPAGYGREQPTSTRCDLPFTQEMMSDALGLSVPHLNRTTERSFAPTG